MNRRWVIAGMAALLFHGLLLFGFRMETAAVPLPVADNAVDVSLVAAAAPATAPAATAPAVPTPEPPAETPPPPAPTPPPPVPEIAPTPQPAPVVQTTPAPREHPPHREPSRPSHPNPSAAKATGPVAPTAPATAGVRSGTSSPVHARYNPKPPYPAEARRLGQQGRVMLEVQVSVEGRATNVSVKHSSGFPILDSAAEQGVREWTFEPARAGGLPISSRAEVPVNFSLAQ